MKPIPVKQAERSPLGELPSLCMKQSSKDGSDEISEVSKWKQFNSNLLDAPLITGKNFDKKRDSSPPRKKITKHEKSETPNILP